MAVDPQTSFPKDQIKVLLLENIHPSAHELFRAEGFHLETASGALGEAELIERIADVHVLGIRSKTRVTDRALAAGRRLLSVGCFCIGTNQVDLAGANRRGVPVFNAPFSNTRSVAEMIIAEIVMLSRRLGDRATEMHAGQWRKVSTGSYEVRGKTLGIVGYGHIGRQVGVLAEMLGMRVLFFDIVSKLPMGNNRSTKTLDELLQGSDFVILVDQPRLIQVVADGESISLSSRPAADGAPARWTRHVTAQLSSSPPAARLDDAYHGNGHHRGNGHTGAVSNGVSQRPEIDQLLLQRGVDGLPFTWSVDAWTPTSNGLKATIALPESLPEGSAAPFLDAAVIVAALADMADPRLYVPASIEQVWVSDALTEPRGSVAVNRTASDGDGVTCDVTLAARSGVPSLTMRSLRYRALDFGDGQPDGAGEAGSDARGFVHTIEWQPRPEDDQARPATGPRAVAVVGDEGAPLGERFAQAGYAPAAASDARYVLYVADSQPAETDVDFAVRTSAEITRLVRTLAERDPDNPAALWIVTRGIHEAATPSAVRQSILWGLAGVIAAEHPELWGGLLDLAVDADLGDAAPALADLLHTPSKSILVLRNGVVLAPSLAPVQGGPARKPLRCRPDAAYLITGGMGALGLLMAGWLADRGARRLVLTGRTPLPPRRDWDLDTLDAGLREKIDAIRALEIRGVAIEAVAADIGCDDDLAALLTKRDNDRSPPIRGIIHAAGVTNDQLVTNMSDGPVREVMWPKVAGSQALHEAFPPGSVDFFFLIASAAAIFGIPGQGSYAAANSYLDAMARSRRQKGCHTMSLDWVAWRGLGFAADAQIVSHELQRMGSRDITPAEAFTAWEYADTYDIAQAVVVPVPTPAGADGSRATDDYLIPARDWSQLSPADVRSELQDGLRRIIAAELRLAESELDVDRPFAELGLNSLMAMAIRREAEQFVGIELSATMLFNHPTVASLAGYLAKLVAPSAESAEDAIALLSASAGSILDSLFDRIESSSPEADRSA